MSELPRQDNPTSEAPEQKPRSLVRRKLLKGIAVAGGLAAAGGIGLPFLFPQKSSPEDNPSSVVSRPEGLPEDTLTEEELQNAHIKIYQTEETKLYLRTGIFNLPLFKDVSAGKLDEVNIILDDGEKPMPEEAIWVLNKTSPDQPDFLHLGSNQLGLFYNTRFLPKNLLDMHPQLKNKVFIFVNVSNHTIRPEQSFPSAKNRIEITPGYTIRHEIGHYDPSGEKNATNESGADKFALKSILEAYEKFVDAGDTSGYPFVFVTKEGMAFTKKQSTVQGEQHA